jgi:hypothetical protein
MVQQLGSTWLERHLNIMLQHLLDLAAQPRAAPTHVDAVYSRQCITFVFRSLLGKMLGEKQQTAACKEFARIINHQMNSIGTICTPIEYQFSKHKVSIDVEFFFVEKYGDYRALLRGLYVEILNRRRAYCGF